MEGIAFFFPARSQRQTKSSLTTKQRIANPFQRGWQDPEVRNVLQKLKLKLVGFVSFVFFEFQLLNDQKKIQMMVKEIQVIFSFF